MGTTLEKIKVEVVGWGAIQACDNCGTRYCDICHNVGHAHGVIVWLNGDSIAQRELCNKCMKEHYEEIK